MCYELTLATSSLYWTARYLASARLVHLHLSGGGSSLETPDREGLDQLIADLGAGLQGPGGAGIFAEQQESIAEMMVDSTGRSSPTMTFRRRLLELPGWEQFTALFLFFISEDNKLDLSQLGNHEENRARFVAKVDHEVDATIKALARLETRLIKICGLNETPPRTATADRLQRDGGLGPPATRPATPAAPEPPAGAVLEPGGSA